MLVRGSNKMFYSYDKEEFEQDFISEILLTKKEKEEMKTQIKTRDYEAEKEPEKDPIKENKLPVCDQFIRLDDEVRELDRSIDELEGRLKMVLDDSPEPDNIKAEPEERVCPLAERLRSLQKTVRSIKYRVQSTISHLQV